MNASKTSTCALNKGVGYFVISMKWIGRKNENDVLGVKRVLDEDKI